MLAYYPPQPLDSSMQTLHYQHHPSSSSSPSAPFQTFDSSQVDLAAYLDSLDAFSDNQQQQMAALATHQPHNPPIRVQQSTPPAAGRRGNSNSRMTMRTPTNVGNGAWENSAQSVGLLGQVHFQQPQQQQQQQSSSQRNGHKRASSNGSSVTSVAPASPLDRTTSSYSQVAHSDSGFSPSAQDFLTPYSAPQHHDLPKFPPTPDTPSSQDAGFLHQNFYTTSQDVDAFTQHLAMRRTLDQDDDAGSYQHSMAPSVSSMSHSSPKTPLTGFPDDFNDESKGLHTDYNTQGANLKIYPDDGYYNPDSPTSAPQNKPRPSMGQSNSLLKSFHQRNMLNDRYQMAQQGHISSRSQSPATSASGEVSPFRQTSIFGAQQNQPYQSQRSPQSRVTTASQLREEQKAQADAMELAQHQQHHEQQPKTISPKDAVYEYHQTPEEAAMPLFPQEQPAPQYSNQFSTPLTLQQSQPFQSQQGTYGMAQAQRDNSNFSPSYGYVPSQPQQSYYSTPLLRQESSTQSAPTPDFPAHLQSMESSLSDVHVAADVQRPQDTSSDAGTYSCTYHGCSQRFESPARLQKHKREAHRQTTPSGMTSQAARNSQAGPHKCTRINPSTGKPCNSEFSRPYDLTRHEDTIHNNRKIKVKCAFCTEDKMFSRSDALTRHMRVVHPEIDYPGKTRRKNARD